MQFQPEEAFARKMDADDTLAPFRDQFHVSDGTVYMLANSLGLMPKSSGTALERVAQEWRDLAIGGWLGGDPPWFYLAERAGEAAATMMGAAPDEVICTGTTTYNVHSLIGTLYRPSLGRNKIVAGALDFPTDIYALKSQMTMHGVDWRDHLVLVEGDESGLVDEDAIIEAMTDEVAIVQLPSVFYRSGQLLDIKRLTKAAHERGIFIGFDCSHSAGVVPHRLDDHGVDYAVWCSYKYLNGGPGSPAFLYLNRNFFQCEPGLAGWFGYVKERQFDLSLEFEHAEGAGGWQVSSPAIPGAAAVAGSLGVTNEAGIDRIRQKSLRMTGYLMYLSDTLLSDPPYGFRVLTPRDESRRGGHVALVRDSDSLQIKEALGSRGVVVDFRPPDVIRIAPSPLYSTYLEIWKVVRHLRDIVDSGEHKDQAPDRREIS